jgi:hypothetical protein
MRRHVLGIVALVLILFGVGSYFHLTGRIIGQSGASNLLLRAGLVLGAIWLAMPQLEKLSPWIVVVAVVGGLAAMMNPFLLVYVVIAVVAIALFQYVARKFLPNLKFLTKPRRTTRGTRSQTRDT